MIAGGYGTGLDLCMRAYGQMDAVDSSWWSFNVGNNIEQDSWRLGRELADSARVRHDRMGFTWSFIEKDSGTFDFGKHDTFYGFRHDSLGCETFGLLVYGPKFYSTYDSGAGRYSDHAPPCSLFANGLNNYWAC